MTRKKSFPGFLKAFKTNWGLASAAVTAGPLLLIATDLTPPWPNESGSAASGIAVLAGIVGLLAAYATGTEDPRWRRRSVALMALGLFLALVYLALWSLLVVSLSQGINGEMVQRRFVTGFSMRDIAAGYEAADAIRTFGLIHAYSPVSLLIGRLSLITAWLGTLFCITYGFGLHQAEQAGK